MKSIYKRNYLIIFFLAFWQISFGQSNEITIRFIGNCGLYMSDGTTDIYSDFPYKSGAHHYMEYDASELDNLKENAYFVFTHKHSDHYYKGTVNRLLKAKNGKKVDRWNMSNLEAMNATIPDFKIEALKTRHLFSFKHYSYVIRWHGKRIFLSGDTEHADVIKTVKRLNWAFMPAWLFVDVIENGELMVDTEMIGIYHIGPRDDINIVGPTILMLKEQGKVISIPY